MSTQKTKKTSKARTGDEGHRRKVKRTDIPSAAVKRLLIEGASAEFSGAHARCSKDAAKSAKTNIELFIKKLAEGSQKRLGPKKTVTRVILSAVVDEDHQCVGIRANQVISRAEKSSERGLSVAGVVKQFKKHLPDDIRVDDESKSLLVAIAEKYAHILGGLAGTYAANSQRTTLAAKDIIAAESILHRA